MKTACCLVVLLVALCSSAPPAPHSVQSRGAEADFHDHERIVPRLDLSSLGAISTHVKSEDTGVAGAGGFCIDLFFFQTCNSGTGGVGKGHRGATAHNSKGKSDSNQNKIN